MSGARRSGDSTSLKRIKAEHLKKRADGAVKKGNYRSAWQWYTECLDILPDKQGRTMVYSGRSFAYRSAGRYEEALNDADTIIEASPKWHEGHFRRGEALIGLKRIKGAAKAFSTASKFAKDPPLENCELMLSRCAAYLTQEELGEEIVELITGLEEIGDIPRTEHDELSKEELREAAYKVVKSSEQGKPAFPEYRRLYQSWLRHGLPKHRALSERARLLVTTKCYGQARRDAMAAAEKLALIEKRQGAAGVELQCDLCYAWAQLSDALLAEEGDPNRDVREAVKWCTKCVDIDPFQLEEYTHKLQLAGQLLTGPELDRALKEIYNLEEDKGRFSVQGSLLFHNATVRLFGSEQRSAFRKCVSEHCGKPVSKVTIEGVRSRATILEVHFEVDFGVDKVAAETFRELVWNDPMHVFETADDLSSLGPIKVGDGGIMVADVTEQKGKEQESCGHEGYKQEIESKAIIPRSSKMQLALPYKDYRLVYADGRRAERQVKHPFCMSRVHYSRRDMGEEVWVEPTDGSCRWRQSSSEVKVLATKVPSNVEPSDLDVVIEPYFLKVADRKTGMVYLSGELERGIVPDDSTWTHCQGEGEDGCALFLEKMNLELVVNPKMHSEMWWPRLFADHPQIAWDDYEKDYSDLPEEILSEHRQSEALEDARKELDTKENNERDDQSI